jgi:mycothiol synthase
VAPDDAAELVVDPDRRGQGIGRELADRLVDQGAARVWAHGDLPAARTLAAGRGWRRVRDLYLMQRPLSAADAGPVELPAGFAARAFAPGADDEAWVETNGAAFAEHPEQGRLRIEDLHERMRLPWFEAAGLIVVEDVRRGPGAPAIAAFHWTKVEPGDAGPGQDRPGSGGAPDPDEGAVAGPSGEVYVLGVHPAYQGRGLAGPVTRLGLAHLARRGLARVHLYVDGDNVPARRTYARLGFVDASVDVMYAA